MALSPVVIFAAFNYRNILLPFSLLLGLIVFPYVVQVEQKRGNIRYAITALFPGIILLFFRSNSMFYFSSVFILFFILERLWGRLNYLSLFLAAIVSPLISNMVYIWSFPIRLQLSSLAGKVLHWVQMDIKVDGNILILDGHTFAVDPACIGLKMVVTSLVLSIIILAYFEKKYRNIIPFWEVVFYLSTVLAGAIIANFMRLLTLIIFHILPENPLHDVVGLLSLGVYILLPFLFYSKLYF